MVKSSTDIAIFIQQYLKEIDGCQSVKVTSSTNSDVWESARVAKVKANFNAAFNRAHFNSKSEIVARNSNGQIMASKAILHNNVGFLFSAEALACRENVRMCTDMGLRDVILEGDSLAIIKKCRSKSRDRSVISPIIQDIKTFVPRFNSIQFQHLVLLVNF